MEDEPSPAALEQVPLPACDGIELSPWRSHGNPFGGTGRPEEKRSREPSPVASAQMPSPTVLGTEQEPLPDASEQMPSSYRLRRRGQNRSRRP